MGSGQVVDYLTGGFGMRVTSSMRRILAAGFSGQKWSGLSPGSFLSATKRPVFNSKSS